MTSVTVSLRKIKIKLNSYHNDKLVRPQQKPDIKWAQEAKQTEEEEEEEEEEEDIFRI